MDADVCVCARHDQCYSSENFKHVQKSVTNKTNGIYAFISNRVTTTSESIRIITLLVLSSFHARWWVGR